MTDAHLFAAIFAACAVVMVAVFAVAWWRGR
jgi:hypothetical protein